jgi:hypothetical protein
MMAARFHARDQWNEMKKTSNIEHPTPKGFSPAPIPELAFRPPAAQPPCHQRLHLLHRRRASHSLLLQGLAIGCSLLGFPLAFLQNQTILAPVIGLVLFCSLRGRSSVEFSQW